MIRKLLIIGALTVAVTVPAVTASTAQGQFTSSTYPTIVSGKSSFDTIYVFGSTVRCNFYKFSGTIAEASTTLALTPSYTECTAFGLPATVNFTSCQYLFHKEPGKYGTVDIACGAGGDAVDINVYASTPHGTPICHVKIPGQSGKGGYFTSNEAGDITVGGSIWNITATQTRTSIFCPAGTHGIAEYTIQTGGIRLSNAGSLFVH